MDMVCVSREPHDWETEGVTIIEENGILKWNGTTLWADNGIGVAVMMALAELEERPTLELLFTMGEEVGLIGAHNLELPITAPYGLNLDWSHSESIGIWCGGTLLMEGTSEMQRAKSKEQNDGWNYRFIELSVYRIILKGMRWGHSGVDIDENRWNALIELAQLLAEREDIHGISEIHGGDADNAIPRSAHTKVLFEWDREELGNWIQEKTIEIQEKTQNTKVEITIEETEHSGDFYEKHIFHSISEVGSGVEIAWDDGTALSSWNLGKMKLVDGFLEWCYFVRTNIPWGIDPMKQKILNEFNSVNLVNWINLVNFELSHESPVWLANADSPFVRKIQESMESANDKKVPTMVTHATVEVGTLAEKYPDTEWISIGATCHDMHTTREHIYLADLEEFCQRMERIIQSI
jgi:dipeptidase D